MLPPSNTPMFSMGLPPPTPNSPPPSPLGPPSPGVLGSPDAFRMVRPRLQPTRQPMRLPAPVMGGEAGMSKSASFLSGAESRSKSGSPLGAEFPLQAPDVQ